MKEQSIQQLWHTIKPSNADKIGISEGKGGETMAEKYIWRNGHAFPKIYVRHQTKNPKSSENSNVNIKSPPTKTYKPRYIISKYWTEKPWKRFLKRHITVQEQREEL